MIYLITIDLGSIEYYDSEKNEFVYEDGGKVRFEYSLKMLYEWEGKWKKPFLKESQDLTSEEALDFYMMMALDPIDEKFMTGEVMKKLSDYINDSQTATKFSSHGNSQNGNNTPSKGKVYTAEELYAMMITAQIPLEFENRNLNRLITILRVISNNNEPPKKMSKQDILRQNAQLNAERRRRMKTRG